MGKRRLVDRLLRRFGLTRTPASGQRTYYAGAGVGKTLQDWILGPISPDLEVRTDLRLLRARSRELCRDHAYAKRYVRLVVTNVVGPKGILLKPRIQNTRDALHATANQRVADAWSIWGEPATASLDGRLSWIDIQQLAMASIAADGEAILRIIRYADNPFAFSLQFIDPDQLDQYFNRNRDQNQNAVRLGVEVDAYNKPIAYWLWDRHPNDFLYAQPAVRQRVPAEDIIHLYRPLRVNQTRGVPWLHAVLIAMKMLEGYTEAEVTAARIESAKMGFLVADPAAIEAWAPPQPDESPEMEANPGMISGLPPGYKFEAWDPQHPGAQFGAFNQALLRTVAAGGDVAYHSLSADMSQANYSSSRMALLPERDEWRAIQQWLITHLHQRVYRAWLEMAILAGALPLPAADLRRYWSVRWLPRGWQWIDPYNDLRATGLALGMGLDSRTRIAAAAGEDFEELLDEIKAEQDLAAAKGVALATDATIQASPAVAPDGEGDGTGDTGGTNGDGEGAPPARAPAGGRAHARLALARALGGA